MGDRGTGLFYVFLVRSLRPTSRSAFFLGRRAYQAPHSSRWHSCSGSGLGRVRSSGPNVVPSRLSVLDSDIVGLSWVRTVADASQL